jgi:transposase-like protein
MSDKDTYTASAAAKHLDVSPTMVYRWLNDRTLTEDFSIEGPGRYVTAESVRALKAKRDAERVATDDDDEKRAA